MAAISSKRTEFAHRIEEKMAAWPDNVKMTGDRKRMFQNIAHVLRALSTAPKITIPTTVSLDKWLREPDAVDNVSGIEEDFDIIIRIACDYGNVAFPPAMSLKLSPVEFIFSVILVHLYKSNLKHDQLAAAIRDMRKFVRAQHADIRTNSSVAKTLEEFIVGQMDQKIATGAYAVVKRPTPIQTGAKRKRFADEDGDEAYVDDSVMDTREDGKRPTPRKRRAPAATPNSASPSSVEQPLFLESPTRNTPNGAMKFSPPPAKVAGSEATTATTSNHADNLLTRTNLSGAIAPAVARRGGWGSGLHSLVGSFKGGQQ
jgi:hypothetical protein